MPLRYITERMKYNKIQFYLFLISILLLYPTGKWVLLGLMVAGGLKNADFSRLSNYLCYACILILSKEILSNINRTSVSVYGYEDVNITSISSETAAHHVPPQGERHRSHNEGMLLQ